ncbi:MAG: hypothetical protein MHPSP_003783, partial [Paramarteilia canceri]
SSRWHNSLSECLDSLCKLEIAEKSVPVLDAIVILQRELNMDQNIRVRYLEKLLLISPLNENLFYLAEFYASMKQYKKSFDVLSQIILLPCFKKDKNAWKLLLEVLQNINQKDLELNYWLWNCWTKEAKKNLTEEEQSILQNVVDSV